MTVGSDQFLAQAVVAWQVRHGRHDLPWQNTRDPYRVWLSEIMLQQTQVVTVLDYFARFLSRFPDVGALANASLDDVLSLWSGLGYYSRARNMHRCAQEVMSHHAGFFPATAQQLQGLPGIGPSTAAAVASLCFSERVAILDGNVKRVLTRYLGFDADLAQAKNERVLWQEATRLLPDEELGRNMPRYTQGMMDLGATLCTTKNPDCPSCPVQARCVAYANGNPLAFPVKSRKLKRSAQSLWLLWARSEDGALWLSQRPTPGVWAGLYCFALFDSYQALQAAVAKDGCAGLVDIPAFKHVLTHKDLYLHPVQVVMPRSSRPEASGDWFEPLQWQRLGLPAPISKLLR
ncbi:MAG: A/G-specific adenine glycosylase [Rhodoferax sp.]|uniref:A/G-specific adenine glycosylase n=1 Tax=Rhodoferax sp. TaxID=50421 RepID=UPI002633BF4D|nr:A/G-specific adenine glycosylase [Rhodoferax sp.]MDD2882686.1 A/G-specific adenine glycosylase [Rhodoferax sp.]